MITWALLAIACLAGAVLAGAVLAATQTRGRWPGLAPIFRETMAVLLVAAVGLAAGLALAAGYLADLPAW